MAEPAGQGRMSSEEFFAWLERQDEPYELVDGYPVPLWPEEEGSPRAMAGASVWHQQIAQNVSEVIRARLPSTCRVTQATTVQLGDGFNRIPDVVAFCGVPGPEDELATDPILIVEILSRTTRNKDCGEKLQAYKLLPSLREVWLVDSQKRWAQIWWRQEGQWVGRDFIGSGSFASAVLGAQVELERLYAGVSL